ncbi:hypothetical protein NW752_007516 [Fusarium irregulare]|uniref:Sulfotransferase n=1 Tax=Fusarium irregulare TaxID=2494466 RepID=A0A9W8U8P6_9HYPO|nr:hypothetical protein NW766_007577 [Fusarium irregulare]KAJ4014745.1 hypothetical protein NW752_007516 [Fusarium irregulare]
MSQTGKQTTPPRPEARYIFVTGPRTASHLLMRILNIEGQGAHPTWNDGYFWLQAMNLRTDAHKNPMKEWSAEEKKSIEDMEQKCFNNLLEYIQNAEVEGNKVMFKEHALLLNHPFFESQRIHGEWATVGEPQVLEGYPDGLSTTRSSLNETILSDDFLKTFRPTFLVRHPALSIPSLFRAVRHEGFKRKVKELNLIETSLFWPRKLLEFYEVQESNGGVKPLVIDADDMMTSPELMLKYARLAGLDPDKLQFEWEKAPKEVTDSHPPIVQYMLGSLNSSNKVDLGKVAGDVNIDIEAAKWREEFGEIAGDRLETHVRAAMGDYEYMRSKRLTI